jgi:hypothetical protein
LSSSVEQLRDVGVSKHVMAAAHAAQLEAETFQQATRIAKRHIRQLATRESD